MDNGGTGVAARRSPVNLNETQLHLTHCPFTSFCPPTPPSPLLPAATMGLGKGSYHTSTE
ncbi:hypothetical protein E2C01_072096 [Portunus trituberculatus]|uniref:Uncharacterized protein n=1 Tax=Portunus trituberculatus TaxID=210409 RepID=A0A5B7I9T7_PORTR|nr:hypothetical protein [Portunus trituberculatus]